MVLVARAIIAFHPVIPAFHPVIPKFSPRHSLESGNPEERGRPARRAALARTAPSS